MSITRSDSKTREAARVAVKNGEVPLLDIAVVYCHAKDIYFVKRYFTHVFAGDAYAQPHECVMCSGLEDLPRCLHEEELGVANNVRPDKEHYERAQSAPQHEEEQQQQEELKSEYLEAVKSKSDDELREILADSSALIEQYYACKGFVTAEDRIREELKAIEHDDADTLTWRGAHFSMNSKEWAALDLMINKRYAEDELRRRGL